MQWKWYYHSGYAGRRCAGGMRLIMHRVIMNPPKSMLVDHKNRNTLDNRRCNLRICSRSQNNSNCIDKNNGDHFKGIWFHKQSQKWCAEIMINSKRIYLGIFITPEEAALVYNEAAKKYFGEFARLNEI